MSPPNRDGNDGEYAGADDDGTGVIQIQNLSTLRMNQNNDVGEPNEVRDEDLSLSTATSATSIASALSDGAPRPRSQPRPNAPSSRPNSTPRQGTPRSRPRSNPRTRTPMRRESPLLITGRAEVLVNSNSDEVGGVEGEGARDVTEINNLNEASAASLPASRANNVEGGENSNAGMVRSLFNARRHRSRAGSIQEEDVEEEPVEINDSSSVQVAQNQSNDGAPSENGTVTGTAPRAGGWLARAAAMGSRRSANPARSRDSINNLKLGLSEKQRPSHRKLRRWNNDRFVGTSSEQIHLTLEENHEGGVEAYWREFYMPNYPCEYRSEFAKLSTDESKSGADARDRFLKGEVAKTKGGRSGKKEDDVAWMEREVSDKLRRLGISMPKTAPAVEDLNKPSLDDNVLGKRLFGSLGPRIQSILSRSCALPGSDGPSFASRVVSAFEGYLVSLALTSSKKDVAPANSYPPLHSQHVYDLFDEVLCGPPKVVIRKKKHKASRGSKRLCAALVPTVHFYFDADGHNSSGGADDGPAKSTAFYRILLHAVCQFHGLDSSSSVVATGNGKLGGRRGGKGKRGEIKVVTVQGGVLLAPSLRLLDYVE